LLLKLYIMLNRLMGSPGRTDWISRKEWLLHSFKRSNHSYLETHSVLPWDPINRFNIMYSLRSNLSYLEDYYIANYNSRSRWYELQRGRWCYFKVSVSVWVIKLQTTMNRPNVYF
jgi:hypothetical protein